MTRQFQKPYCTECENRINSILSDITDPALAALDSAKACYTYKKGQTIFAEGIPPTGLFCIHKGKVKIFKTGSRGREKIMRLAKNGDVLGYRSLISGGPATVSAAALEESIICCIPPETFFNLMRANGGFSLRIIQLLTNELTRAEQEIVHLAQKPVRERLAEALVVLKRTYGAEDEDDSLLNVQLTREELASMIGTAIETLVRTIGEFKKEQLITTEKKRIRILDLPSLVKIGNVRD
jgi:CRP/FNR family transcriptional regulator